ncbi:MAG TPA: hypothetical protein VF171_09455, partial [Trueperaceae bacterium]
MDHLGMDYLGTDEPSYVKLGGYKGRSDLNREDGRLTWVTTEAELESASEDLNSLARWLEELQATGQPVELELMTLETDPRNPNRFWEDGAERRATVAGVGF